MTGLAGFLLAFLLVFGSLLLFAVARPSLWMPLAVGVGLYTLTFLWPAARKAGVGGVSALTFVGFGSYLWMLSGNAGGGNSWPARLDPYFKSLFLVLGLVASLLLLGRTVSFKFKPKPKIGPILVLIVLGCLICFFSSSKGGASPMVEWVVQNFHLSRSAAENLVVGVRKTLHFLFYGTVAICGYAASYANGGDRKRALLSGILTAFLFAGFDELRQSTMPDRGSSGWDVALDLAGAATMLALINLKQSRKAHPRKA